MNPEAREKHLGMGHLRDRYRQWRGRKLLRHGSVLLGIALTLFSLVVLPGQWVPVLFRDDLTVICTSLVIFAVGMFVGTTSTSRRGVASVRTAMTSAFLVALGLTAFAVAVYKTAFGGIGWPGPVDLVFGIVFVLVCVVAGILAGNLSKTWPRPLPSALTSLGVLLLAGSGLWLFTIWFPNVLNPSYKTGGQSCETRNDIRYCANPGYEPFIDEWQRALEQVFAAAPVEVDRSETVVAQLLDADGRRAEDASIAPGFDWGRGSGRGVAELALGLEAANWVTGIESREILFDPNEAPETCAGGNGSRAVVAYWLAGQVSADAASVIGDLGCCADAISGSTFGAPAIGGGWETATELLEMPREDVARHLANNWERITARDAPVTRLGEIFDLSVPPSAGEPLEAGFTLCESRSAAADQTRASSGSPLPDLAEEDLESNHVTSIETRSAAL